MPNILEQILEGPPLEATAFPPNSRYHGFRTLQIGSTVYLERRFIPSPDRFPIVRLHRVVEGERLDNITARYLVDPEVYWRIADANGVMKPEELEEAGREIRIALPTGVRNG